jgi:hypothetical protein
MARSAVSGDIFDKPDTFSFPFAETETETPNDAKSDRLFKFQPHLVALMCAMAHFSQTKRH